MTSLATPTAVVTTTGIYTTTPSSTASGSTTTTAATIEPPRIVGESYVVQGAVVNVFREAYCIKIDLQLDHATNPFYNGEIIRIQFTGIGDVSTWQSYSLSVGQHIRVPITWVEASYWEAIDSEITPPIG
jgi:hypothetical protein